MVYIKKQDIYGKNNGIYHSLQQSSINLFMRSNLNKINSILKAKYCPDKTIDVLYNIQMGNWQSES